MAYTKNVWTDRDVQYPNRYTLTNVSGTTYDVARAEGTINEAGTLFNADKMNNIEDGIDSAHAVLGSATSADLTKLHAITADATELNILDGATLTTTELNYVDGVTSAIQTQLNNLNVGWLPANETWTYSSVDDPTGNITISGDVTTKYSLGMRIKFTNGGNMIYGIITKLAYSSPNTTMTFLHQIDPTDSLALYLMANSAITANYYSVMKVPYGFPLETNKWSVYFSNNTEVSTNTPTSTVWYNYSGFNLSVPIGCWNISYQGNLGDTSTASQTIIRAQGTLSTANNAESDEDLSVYIGMSGASSTITGLSQVYREKRCILLTSKTTYYLNYRTTVPNCAQLLWIGNRSKTIIQAVCAYL